MNPMKTRKHLNSSIPRRRESTVPQSSHGHEHGFTMIELTTVALIILVLIAIALPNFLEAQIRARTTAVTANLEVVAHALEEYYIAYRNYPVNAVAKLPDGSLPGDENPHERGRALTVLTTPVVYLSSLPYDLFSESDQSTDFLDYINFVDLTGGPISMNTFQSQGSAAYLIASIGPNGVKETWAGRIPPSLISYAPTNGTKSAGDLHRFGP
jgi:prepilin-type N-terminal cleavage/methylation domain-containing protein